MDTPGGTSGLPCPFDTATYLSTPKSLSPFGISQVPDLQSQLEGLPSVCLERNGERIQATLSGGNPNNNNYSVRTLRRGKHRMILWPDREADGTNETTTPSKIVGTRDEKGRLEKVR